MSISIELPAGDLLRRGDEIIANSFLDTFGRIKTARVPVESLMGGVATLQAGDNDLIEEDHRGRFLDVDNSGGEVGLLLPDANDSAGAVDFYGPVFCGAVRSGSHPVYVQTTIAGQLKAARPGTATFTGTKLYIGPSTANAEGVAFRVLRRDGGWTLDCPGGSRLSDTDDVTLEAGTPGATQDVEVRDQDNNVVVSALSRLDLNGAVSVSSPGTGHLELTVTASSPSEATLAFANPITWDVTASQVAKLTLTGNTLIDASNIVSGAQYRITVTQDATGGRAITWGNGFTDKPDIELAASAVTVLVFQASDGALFSPGNVGTPQTLGGLNVLSVIDAAADRTLIERDSDGAAFATTPELLFSAVVAPIDEATDARTLADSDNNRIIRLTAVSSAVEVTDELSQGFACTLINRTGEDVTIVDDGVVTLIGDTVLSDNHIATILVDADGVLCRVSG